MSRKGCSPDNAACEGFFGRLKTELFYPRDWRSTTVEQFIEVVDSYIRCFGFAAAFSGTKSESNDTVHPSSALVWRR